MGTNISKHFFPRSRPLVSVEVDRFIIAEDPTREKDLVISIGSEIIECHGRVLSMYSSFFLLASSYADFRWLGMKCVVLENECSPHLVREIIAGIYSCFNCKANVFKTELWWNKTGLGKSLVSLLHHADYLEIPYLEAGVYHAVTTRY